MNSDIPISAQVDVLVVGGGPAGFAAAVAAARSGVKTLLVERYGFLGGMATAGLVNPFMVSRIEGELNLQGIFGEVIDRLNAENAAQEGELFGQPHIVFDSEILKSILQEMVKESGAKPILHSLATGVILKDNILKGIAIENKSGQQRILSKVIIDATGDGDIAFMAGVPCETGRKEDGLAQPMTLNFRVGGVDTSRMPSRDEINRLYIKAKKDKEFSCPREKLLWFETIRAGELHFNTTRVPKRDGTKVEDLTAAELEARQQVMGLVRFLKNRVPGFENSYLLSTAAQIGVRETRRIKGEYVLTKDNILCGQKFEDAVARASYPIDIHNPEGEGTIFQPLPEGVYYEIPYRCLVPQKIDNLLVAGRPISVTHEALSSTRVMPTCMATGEAAGTAAAISAKKNIIPRKIDYQQF